MREPAPNADLRSLRPDFRLRVLALIKAARGIGVRLVVVEAKRAQTRQDWLRKNRPGVTRTKRSRHTRGEAVDLRVEGLTGDAERAALERVTPLANQVGLDNPFDWDLGHFQYQNGSAKVASAVQKLARVALFAGAAFFAFTEKDERGGRRINSSLRANATRVVMGRVISGGIKR